jgi:hypothetical protein
MGALPCCYKDENSNSAMHEESECKADNLSEDQLVKNLETFEKKYPFYLLHIRDYVGRIKRFVQID